MDVLPEPKKHPRQSRSKALVEAVLDASLLILDDEASDTLTMEHLSEVSGVGVGSIYQYFDSKEGVIAAVYKRLLHEEAMTLSAIGEKLKTLQVQEALRLIFANALRVELRLHRLSKSFHAKYYKQLHLSEYLELPGRPVESVDLLWLDFIDYFSDVLQPENANISAMILAKGYRDMIRAIMEIRPDMVDSDDFVDILVAMALACLNYQPTARR